MLSFYRHIFWLRRRSPALYGGSYRPLESEGNTYVYLRESGVEHKLVALNFADQPVIIHLKLERDGLPNHGQLLLSTHLDRETAVDLTAIELRPFEGIIIDL